MEKMPVVFVGHGTPMNAIEENSYTDGWRQMAAQIPRPKAILAISAHWYTEGSRVNDSAQPETIYDMYGFPKELYDLKYPSPGLPSLAMKAKGLLDPPIPVRVDNKWGIDHGTWSVLHHMYPKADIPVVQLSVNHQAGPEHHFAIGQKLKSLREQGILILASGNVVHNLRLVQFGMAGGHSWATEFDTYIKENILTRNFKAVINYQQAGKSAQQSVPTSDHFDPLLYILGASDETDQITVFNDERVMGALSMTSYLFK